MKWNISKISVLFCHFFIFCLIILIWTLATLKAYTTFRPLAPHRSKSFCYWYYRERLKNSIFYYFRFNFFFFQNNESALQNEDLLTRTVKVLLKYGRMKEIEPLYIVNSLTVTKNSRDLSWVCDTLIIFLLLFIRIE